MDHITYQILGRVRQQSLGIVLAILPEASANLPGPDILGSQRIAIVRDEW
jgi:hypothetical protein